MRYIAGLFTIGVLIVGGAFAFVGMHHFSRSADRTMFTIGLLAFMASLAALGALLETRPTQTDPV